MSFSVEISAPAEADMREAIHWHHQVRAGLGADLLLCFEEAIARIEREPLAYPVMFSNVRRVLTRRFPYGIFFAIEGKRIMVLAVFHCKRDPVHWRKRMQSH